jgi:hypothetical protein
MALSMTLAGTAVTPVTGTLRIEQIQGSRHLCTFQLADKTGTEVLHPAMGDEVIVLDGATRIFGGIISTITEGGLVKSAEPKLLREITAQDYGAYCDGRLVTVEYLEEDGPFTLAEILTDLITAYLATPFTITDGGVIELGGGSGPGPNLTAFSATDRTLTEVFNDLTTATGYQWTVTYLKVCKFFAVGALTAAWNITSNDGHVSELSWDLTRDNYRNVQYVRVGANAEIEYVDTTFAGTGAAREFDLRYPGAGSGLPLLVTENLAGGAVSSGCDFWVAGYAGPAFWAYDYNYPTSEFGRVVQATGRTTLAVGESLMIRQYVSFPVTFRRPAVMPASPWEALVELPDVYDRDIADAYADSLLAQYGEAKKVRFRTFDSGLLAGTVITITIANRHLSGTFLIAQVTVSHVPETAGTLVYDIECVEGDYNQSLFTDTYRQWAATSGGGSTVSVSGSGSGVAVTVLHADLGGSRLDYRTDDDWMTVPVYKVFKCKADGAYVFRHESKVANAGVTVSVRLYDLSASPPAAVSGSTSTAHNATDWTEVEAGVTLIGGHKYRAEMKGSNATYGIYCGQATLEL